MLTAYAPHARAQRRVEPDLAVLDDEALRGVHVQALRGRQVDLGVGLLVLRVVTRQEGVQFLGNNQSSVWFDPGQPPYVENTITLAMQ